MERKEKDDGCCFFVMTIKNKFEEMDSVNEQIDVFTKTWNVANNTRGTMKMAAEELISNIISYGYTDDEEHEIEIKIELINDAVTMTIADDGIPFNPLQVAQPDIHAPLTMRKIGGLGIHLVREMLDQVSYRRCDNQNVVILTLAIT